MDDSHDRWIDAWQDAALVIGEACLHCGRALEAATAWRVAVALVGPDDAAGPARAVGGLHAECIEAYLASQTERSE